MKKNQKLQTGMIAIAALIVGILIGSAVQWPNFRTDDLRGSIGRVDRYRNVQITEHDIALRNELLGDSKLQEQYRDYLNYYYIKAVQTSNNIFRLMEVSAGIDAFQPVYSRYEQQFKSYRQFMNSARVDILNALTAVVSLSRDQELPVVESLNQAGNAIARMRQLDGELAEFMMAIFDFLHDRPDQDYPALADIHDLLAMSLIEAAHITQNKPLLSYLHKKPLINNEEGIKELIASHDQLGYIRSFYITDTQNLSAVFRDTEQIGSALLDMQNHLGSISQYINSSINGDQLFFDADQFRNMAISNEAMQNAMSAINQLSAYERVMYLIN